MQSASQPISPVLETPATSPGQLQFSFLTAPGINYIVEYKTALNEPLWTTLQLVAGNGDFKTVTDSTSGHRCRFYRVRVQ